MASQQKCVVAAAELLGTTVFETVPLMRRKKSARAYTAVGVVGFGAVVLLHQLGVIPGPSLLVYLVAALPMGLMVQLGTEPVFAARTPGGIEMTSSTRWNLRPVGPRRGRLDPAAVSGPKGMGNRWDIAGVRHLAAIWHVARFQKMLTAATVGESAP